MAVECHPLSRHPLNGYPGWVGGGGGVLSLSLYHPYILIHASFTRSGSNARRDSTAAPAYAILCQRSPCSIDWIWRLRRRKYLWPPPPSGPVALGSSWQWSVRSLAITMLDGRFPSAEVWKIPHGVLQKGGPRFSHFAVVEGLNCACYQGSAFVPTPLLSGDIPVTGNGPYCGAHPVQTCFGTYNVPSPGDIHSRIVPLGIKPHAPCAPVPCPNLAPW